MPELRRITRALLSVSDKSGLIDFARALSGHGIELVSTGGTAKAIADAGLKVGDVSELTGFPEIMDGRVKTLHPKVHGGLLAIRDDARHAASMKEHGIAPIDLLVVNLYPFEATVAKGAAFDDCIENIDIGGPAMIRAAAKNHNDVAVVVDADDYARLLDELKQHGGATTLALRKSLAQKAYARTAAYDAAISNWFANELGEAAPAYRAFGGKLLQPLRYGENPHQSAAFYRAPEQRFGVATARQVQGKELSYNNINDTDAAYECVAEFDPKRPACVIVKHANPCGVAVAEDITVAYERAHACDPVSAFGGIVAVNRPLPLAAAKALAPVFTEVVVAPGYDGDALAALTAKTNLRVLTAQPPGAPVLDVRPVDGGLLVQEPDPVSTDRSAWWVVSATQPTEAQWDDLQFAWTVCAAVSSNAIVFAKDRQAYGIGAGQQNRLDSARIAAERAGDRAVEGVCASDAFFPFRDGVDVVAAAGITAIIQPGGSIRDAEVIEAADEHGMAMVFTGQRHFRH